MPSQTIVAFHKILKDKSEMRKIQWEIKMIDEGEEDSDERNVRRKSKAKNQAWSLSPKNSSNLMP